MHAGGKTHAANGAMAMTEHSARLSAHPCRQLLQVLCVSGPGMYAATTV